jgi:predicted DsbA family dithiol-disulfide isomerase
LRVRHQSFVLVAEDRSDRTFSDYHRAHRDAARRQDDDAPTFQLPQVGARYPRSSLPALEAAAWVRESHPASFPAFDQALFEAFFERTEDISDPVVLARITVVVGLDPAALEEVFPSGAYRRIVLQEHREASDRGIRGVPAVLIAGQDPIIGAVPYAALRQAIEDGLARTGGAGPEDRSGGRRGTGSR